MKPLKIILLSLLIFLLLLVGGTVLWTLLAEKKLEDSLPEDVTAYLEIPSLKQIYADWMNLDSVDLILSSPGMENAGALLADLRRQGWSENPTLGALLEVPAGIVLTRSGAWVAAFDLGWRSALTRWMNLLGHFWVPDGLGVYRQSGRNLYFWQSGEDRVYILFLDNLVLTSNKAEELGKVFQNTSGKSILGQDHHWPQLPGSSQVKFLFQPQPFLKDASQESGGWISWLLRENLIPEWTTGAIRADSRGVDLGVRTRIPTENRDIRQLLDSSPGPLKGMERLPKSTILATAVNLAELPEVLQIWSGFDGTLEEKVSGAQEGLKTAFGQGLDELIYSWLGKEWGGAYLEGSAQPVLWLEVKDQGALERSLATLEASWALEGDQRLVVDGLRVRRLSIPGYLQTLLGVFGLELPTTYLWYDQGLVWISLDPKVLTQINQGLKEGLTLGTSDDFRDFTAGQTNPALAAFYDLNKNTPWFLKSRQVWSRLLGLYARGWVQLGPRETDWELRWTTRLSRPVGWAPAPGFPRPWEGDPESPWWYGPTASSSQIRTVFKKDRQTLVFSEPSDLERRELTLEPGSDYLLWQSGEKLSGVWVWNSQGTVNLYSPQGELQGGYPVESASGPSTPSLGEDGSLWFSASGSWFQLTPQGNLRTGALPFQGPVVHPPVVITQGVWWYERSFSGKLWGFPRPNQDQAGLPLTGWPVENLGLSTSGPAFVPQAGGLVQVSSTGNLGVWYLDGTLTEGFPMELGGLFRSPVMGVDFRGQPALALVNAEGRVTFVSPKGDLVYTWQDPQAEEADQWKPLAELLGQKPVFLIYGRGQYLRGLDGEGRSLPGFPLQGYGEPRLLDLNGDGKPELLSPGLDRRLYAHQWYGEEK